MTTFIQDGKRRCDERCHSAKSVKCHCICGGQNHGKGHPQKDLFRKDKDMKEVAELLNFRVHWQKTEAVYGLKIEKVDGKTIVILTELADNPGISVTNTYKNIATKVKVERLADVNPEDIIWIEHYTPDFIQKEGSYDLVKLKWTPTGYSGEPQWKRIKETDIPGRGQGKSQSGD